MKEFFSNKRNIIVCLSVLIVLIVGIVLIVLFAVPKTGKSKLEAELKEMGKGFYENFYYDLVVGSNGIDNISKFESIGIKVDLDNLSRQNQENKKKIEEDFKNNDKECNKENTKVTIYPKNPYGKTDYTMEVQLDCGFEK